VLSGIQSPVEVGIEPAYTALQAYTDSFVLAFTQPVTMISVL